MAAAGVLRRHPHRLGDHARPTGADRVADLNVFSWFPVAGLHANVGLLVDPLSMTMALFVTGVSTVIHLYSIGYMHRDPGFDRFFIYLNLFLFSMVVLVLADNFLFSFLGWEGVGFCSYGLVGFWFQREVAAVAAKKAFITNRVGDVGFLLAMFLMFAHFGSVNYTAVLGHARPRPRHRPAGRQRRAIAGTTATAITLLLFLGAVGKSAQIPLYIWLPDAMEGPTPISALIHAATMVTAGVYLMARVAPMLHYAHATSWVIACTGAGTAFLAATIACAQDDIKKALAYSTISQLGLHVPGHRGGRLRRRAVPHADPRLLQGAPVPGGRGRHPRHGQPPGHEDKWAACASTCPSPFGPSPWAGWPSRAYRPWPASGPRTPSCRRPGG